MSKRITAFIISIIMIFSFLLSSSVCAEEDGSEREITLANWMSLIPGYVPISRLNIPGTHDSGTKDVGIELVTKTLSTCQDKYICEQLEHGIRVFDIRLTFGRKQYYRDMTTFDTDKIYVTHGGFVCEDEKGHIYTFDKVLSDCNDFLYRHPTETIILKVTDEEDVVNAHNIKDVHEGESEAMKQKIREYKDKVGSMFGTKYSVGDPVPTLGELRGKILLIDDADGKMFTKYEDHCDVEGEKKWEYLENAFKTSVWQNFYDTDDTFCKQDLENMEKTTPEGDPDVKFVFTSSNALTGGSPETIADYVNPLVEDYNFTAGKHYGWVMMDFPTDKMIWNIINTNVRSAEAVSEITWEDGFFDYNYPTNMYKVYRIDKDGGRIEVPGNYYNTASPFVKQSTKDRSIYTVRFTGLPAINSDGECICYEIDVQTADEYIRTYGERQSGHSEYTEGNIHFVKEEYVRPLSLKSVRGINDMHITIEWNDNDNSRRTRPDREEFGANYGGLRLKQTDAEGNSKDIIVRNTLKSEGIYYDYQESYIYVGNMPDADENGDRYTYELVGFARPLKGDVYTYEFGKHSIKMTLKQSIGDGVPNQSDDPSGGQSEKNHDSKATGKEGDKKYLLIGAAAFVFLAAAIFVISAALRKKKYRQSLK